MPWSSSGSRTAWATVSRAESASKGSWKSSWTRRRAAFSSAPRGGQQVTAFELDRALVGVEEADEHRRQRRLARPAGADEADDLALEDLDADAVDGGDLFLAPEPAPHRIGLAAGCGRRGPAPRRPGRRPPAARRPRRSGGTSGGRPSCATVDLLRAAAGERAAGGDLGRVRRVAPDAPQVLHRRQRGPGVEQRPGVRVAGAVQHLLRRADLGQPPPVEDGHPVGQHLEGVGVVAHHDQRPAALPPQAAEDLEHPVAGGGVEAGRGLVEHEHLGVADQGEGQQHQAALASGQLPGIALQGPFAEAHGLEDLACCGRRPPRGSGRDAPAGARRAAAPPAGRG